MKCEVCHGERTEDRCLLCEMFAVGQPPGGMTDSVFFSGMSTNGSQFGGGKLAEQMGDKLAKDLIARGGSPKGKVYIGGLAQYPGDPEAWVSDRSDIRRVCEERNYDASDELNGKVLHKADTRKCIEHGKAKKKRVK